MQNVFREKIATTIYTFIALLAFAANSVLCRMALKGEMIDVSSFTIIRLLSGVLMFTVLLSFTSNRTQKKPKQNERRWQSSILLFVYAITFSLAYVSLDTGTGALVLFGAVQLTMIVYNVLKGSKLHFFEWFGIAISFSGLVYLVYPTLTTPTASGFVLMLVSGIAWGGYTLFGKQSTTPLIDTASNFTYTIPLVLILCLFSISTLELSNKGIILAVMSGAFASALGYTIWYLALRGLSSTQAAVVQLSVPVIAAIGGVIFVSDPISERLVLACILVLGGIFIVVASGIRIDNQKDNR